ncbi:MAG: UDP-N-acetylglucosamine 2-epimerase (non-hydrolyzing) [Calditrichaeota bacterium]|nr:UDP-N-acetylglucosamine 2-epimerase (non-hydrolyzing) [Calditrichota bacterium]
MRIASIVGARPNIVKLAPLYWELAKRKNFEHIIIHTGQHYDDALSSSFFEIYKIHQPNINLNIGSASHGIQTGQMMTALEPEFDKLQPDWILTLGDVNSTLAAALTAVKMGLKTAHIEAGLRSFDRTMPEEINRVVTDSISDLLFTTDDYANENLSKEGVDGSKIHKVGNIMIDVLIEMLPNISTKKTHTKYGLEPQSYIVGTFHRPANVDEPARQRLLIDIILSIAKKWKIILPLHPRTRSRLEQYKFMQLLNEIPAVIITEPQNYIDFISLVQNSFAVITDSGGIQAETTWLGIPNITFRDNTEWQITLSLGTNRLVPLDAAEVMYNLHHIERGEWRQGQRPPLWDGKTASRIIDILQKSSIML